jgi:hypothetical protein
MYMKVQGTFTKADVKLISSLMLRPHMSTAYAGFGLGVPAIILLAWHRGDFARPSGLVSIGALLIPAFLIFGFFPYLHYRRLCKEPNLLNTAVTLFICNETIRTEMPDTQTECRWETFRSFREESKAFVLYTSKTNWRILPKRWLTEEQVEELRGFLPAVIHTLANKSLG